MKSNHEENEKHKEVTIKNQNRQSEIKC